MNEVRICENCQHHNDTNNLECEKCGFDLSFVVPTNEDDIKENSNTSSASDSTTDGNNLNSEKCKLVITSVDGQITIPISNELVIGRDGIEGAYFDKSKYVSRKHAIFYIENGEVLLFDASTNGTFVNDKRLPKLTKVPINSSDKITFADVTFEVKYAN